MESNGILRSDNAAARKSDPQCPCNDSDDDDSATGGAGHGYGYRNTEDLVT